MTDASTIPAGQLRLNDDEARSASVRFSEPEALQTGMLGQEYGNEGMVKERKLSRPVVVGGGRRGAAGAVWADARPLLN